MKKLPLIVGICYVFYGTAILFLVSFKMLEIVALVTENAGQAPIPFLHYLPTLIFGFVGLVSALLSFLLSFLLIKRRRRITCLVIAGIFCIGIPLGTILGISTIIILTRSIIKEDFSS